MLHSCLVRKLIQERLNISIQHIKIGPFCGLIIAQIFPKHRLAYTISKIFRGNYIPRTSTARGGPLRYLPPARPSAVRVACSSSSPNVEHKSAPLDLNNYFCQRIWGGVCDHLVCLFTGYMKLLT